MGGGVGAGAVRPQVGDPVGAWIDEELRVAVAAGAIERSSRLLSPPMPSDSDEI